MPSPFLLDTNAYFLLFQNPQPSAYLELIRKLKTGTVISFYISEITSMEIHSVLGKYRRGVQVQSLPCEREIVVEIKQSKCSNTWTTLGRRQLKPKVFRAMQKMVSDIEKQRGDIQATILPLDSNIIRLAQRFLIDKADRYAFGSQDALIAATAMVARQTYLPELTLITSDKGLKAAVKEQAIPLFDPLKPE